MGYRRDTDGRVVRPDQLLAELLTHQRKRLERQGPRVARLSLRAWHRAVGPGVARHATPVWLRDGVLGVAVTTADWRQQLTAMRPQLLAALQRDAPEAGIVEVRIVPGAPRRWLDSNEPEPEESASDEAGTSPMPGGTVAPSDEDLRTAREQLGESGIDDDELREALTRLMALDLAHRRRR